jgi:hypothetical protein
MEPQDRLDALLPSRSSTRQRWALPESQREELEPLLDLADDLALVRNVLPASTFADDLEARLLARAGFQRVEPGLRHDDGENATTLPSISAFESSHPSARQRISVRPSWRVWASLVAALLLLLSVATFSLAAYASPGSALYGVRRWQEDARTNLALSDVDRAKLHIQYATDALDALDAAVAQQARENVYNEALGRFTDELRQAQDALNLVPAGSNHDALTESLNNVRMRGRDDLRTALPAVGWPARISTTRALRDLGEQVLTVTRVVSVSSSVQVGHMWTIAIAGSGFQSGAILLVKQRPAGHVVSVTPTRLVAQVTNSGDDSLPRDIGVGNPDYTAASTSQVSSEHDDGPEATGTPGGGDHGSSECEREDIGSFCTPTPSSTPPH